MASSIKKIEISKVGATIEMLTINAVKPNAPDCYALSSIKSVIPTYNLNYGRSGINTNTTYPFTDQLMVTVNFDNEHANPPIRFDIQTVQNQAGWTADFPGLQQAVVDICGWMTLAAGGGAVAATESTQQAVLTAIQNHQDFETKLVRDTGNADKVVCEVAEYDEALSVYTYSYKDVGGAAYVTVGPLEYLDPDATLNLLLAASTPLTGILTGILRVAGAGVAAVSAGKRSVSFFNAGAGDTNVNGSVIKPGESITYPELSSRDTYASIPYDALTSELVITTVG